VTAVSECDVAVVLPEGNDLNRSYQIHFFRGSDFSCRLSGN